MLRRATVDPGIRRDMAAKARDAPTACFGRAVFGGEFVRAVGRKT